MERVRAKKINSKNLTMAIDIKIGNREASVRLINKEGSMVTIDIDGITYSVDILNVEEGAYSVLHGHKSYNIELIPGNEPKKYYVNTHNSSYDVEVIDAQRRYQRSRNSESIGFAEKTITAPMPGKVVRIPVTLGQRVAKGDTLIVISAMKMESDYKASIDGIITKILVKEGDSVASNQALIEVN